MALLIISLFYFATRLLLEHNSLLNWSYTVYLFDLIFIASFSFNKLRTMKWSELLSNWPKYGSVIVLIVLNIILGLSVYLIGSYFKYLPPFDFQSYELLCFLLVVGPLLEEFIFRGILWSFYDPQLNSTFRISISSFLFSLFHFSSIWGLPNEFWGFVFFQSVYTFIISLFWSWQRSLLRPILFVVVLHMSFNAGFFWGHKMVNPTNIGVIQKEILVLDMAIDEKVLIQNDVTGVELLNLESPVELSNCHDQVKALEDFMLKKGTDYQKWDYKRIAYGVHGYHVLGSVLKYLDPSKIVFLGVSGTYAEDFINLDEYKEKKIRRVLSKADLLLDKFHPKVFLLSSSESFEENLADLKESHIDNAQKKAADLLKLWKESWTHLIRKYPQTTFVVSAGNGGLDGVGDYLSNSSDVFPAALVESNLIRVASSNFDHCLSSFSNYPAHFIEQGELVSSMSGCREYPQIRLTGTSQSAAEVAGKLAAGYQYEQVKESCLKNRAIYYFPNTK